MNHRWLVGIAAAGLMLAQPVAAQNLITNGDFEMGDSGFTSSYMDRTPGQAGLNNDYTISTGTAAAFPGFFNAATFGPQSGALALFADGSTGGNAFYMTTVAGLTTNTDYTFSFYAANANNDGINPAVFEASANGSVLGTLSPGATAGVYALGSFTFNTGLLTLASLSVRDVTTTSGGNDFAFDNVSLVATATPVPGPVAGAGIPALLALGGAFGFGRARRRRAAATI